MKKLLLLFLALAVISKAFSQDLFLRTGLNHTMYSFKDQNGEKSDELIPGIGSSFQFGIGVPFAQEYLKYELGLAINSFNASGGDISNNYSWNTTYGGVNNSLAFYPLSGEFSLGILANLGLSAIVSGTQSLNNSRYDLKGHPEFKGVLVQPGLGMLIAYNIFSQGFLSLQYDYSRSIRLRQKPEEQLTFLNNQILFGIHFQLD